MGLKENFSQAVRELTGGGKEEKDKKSSQVNELRKAMTEDTETFPAVNSAPEVEETNENSAPYFKEEVSEPVEEPTYAQPNPYAQQNPYAQPNPYANQYTAQTNYGAPQQNAYTYGAPQNDFAQPQQAPVYPQAQQQSAYSTMTQNMSDNDELTIISKNTVIDGNVRSFANMNIDGNIRGDVETTKNISLNGKIVGNVTCNNANMTTSQVQGNVLLKGAVNIERDTLLIGDISSTYATINGKVKGNVDITGKAQFKADAVIFGDISASTITVDDGAIIQGYVSTTFLNKEESANIFPDAIAIGD